MQGKRLERVNQLIKEEISMLLQRELKDPRLGFITVTEVDVTTDLKRAKVYVSVLGSEEQWASSFQALQSARGFVWNWLRRHLALRATPEIAFRPDPARAAVGLRPGAAGGAPGGGPPPPLVVFLPAGPHAPRGEDGVRAGAGGGAGGVQNRAPPPNTRRYGTVNWIDPAASATGE